VLYGLLPIVIGFAVRSVGNIVDSLVWLKNITPFGWVDKLHPFGQPQAIWLLPLAVLSIACCAYAIWLAGQRDLNDSLIADNDTAKPRFHLLRSPLGFAWRQTRSVLIGYLVASAAFGAVIAAVTKTVATSLAGTTTLTKTFSNLSGNPS